MNIEERDACYDEVVEKVNSGEWTWGEAIRKLRVDVAKVNQAKFSRILFALCANLSTTRRIQLWRL